MRKPRFEKIAAITVCVIALVMMAVGYASKHQIYDKEAEEFGLLAFTNISDAALIVDTTFGGATREGERLYSTYDRSQPRGKKSCPT